MHLWKVTFAVGDFGRKSITVETEERTSAGYKAGDYVEAEAMGGFAEAEAKALAASQQETSGWPSPIEILSIEYLDEIDAPSEPPRPATTKAKKK